MNKKNLEKIKKKNIEKNRQLASLLEKNSDFQKSVKSARKELGTPAKGFVNGEEFIGYCEEKIKEVKNKDFQEYCDELFYILSGKLMKEPWKQYGSKLLEKNKNDFASIGKFVLFIDDIVKKHLYDLKLMYNMEEFFKYYTFFNSFPDNDVVFLSLPRIEWQKSNADSDIRIVINNHTTQEELKAIWDLVQEEQRIAQFYMPVNNTKFVIGKSNSCSYDQIYKEYKSKPHYKKILMLERDSMIAKLDSEGLENKAIMKIINDKFDAVIGYNDVDTILKRYKKRIKTE